MSMSDRIQKLRTAEVQDDNEEFTAEVESLMGMTSRLASAERTVARGWDWQWVGGELKPRLMDPEDAAIEHMQAWLDLVLNRPPLGKAA